MDELINEYVRCARGKKATSTLARYERELRKFATFLKTYRRRMRRVKPEKVRAVDIRAFLNQEEETSKFSWNMQRAALKDFYTHLQERELVKTNPVIEVKRQEVPRDSDLNPPELEEVVLLVDAMEQSPPRLRNRNKCLVSMFYHCGLRITEVTGLKTTQVHLHRNRLARAVIKGGKRYDVPLNDIVQSAIVDYLVDRTALVGDRKHDCLFVNRDGRPLTVRAVQAVIYQAANRAGLYSEERPVTTHSLRRAHASDLNRFGVDMRTIQKQLGHSSLDTTQRYVYTNFNARIDAVQILADKWRDHVKDGHVQEIRVSRNSPTVDNSHFTLP